MANMTAATTQISVSKTKTAIVTLQNEYHERPIDDMVAEMCVFENETKAKNVCCYEDGQRVMNSLKEKSIFIRTLA